MKVKELLETKEGASVKWAKEPLVEQELLHVLLDHVLKDRRTTGGRGMRPLSQTNRRLLRETDGVATRGGRINRILQGRRMRIPAK